MSKPVAALVVLACLGLWPKAARSETELNQINEIRVEEAGELSTITIVGSAPPEYRVVSQARPARLVIELSNARAVRLRRPRGAVRTGQISSLALGARFVSGEPEARVLIALHGSVAYNEEIDGTSLVLRLVSVEAEGPAWGGAGRPGIGGPLPGGTESSESVEEVIEDAAQSAPPALAPPPAVAPRAPTVAPPPAPAASEAHVVGVGDSLARIAARYGVTARDLVDWNADVVPGRLRIGQRIVVRNPGTITHRVREGDTLSLISQRYGVTIEDIIGWNPGTISRDRLRPGSSLVVHTTRP
jgi:LysM repeat protein